MYKTASQLLHLMSVHSSLLASHQPEQVAHSHLEGESHPHLTKIKITVHSDISCMLIGMPVYTSTGDCCVCICTTPATIAGQDRDRDRYHNQGV